MDLSWMTTEDVEALLRLLADMECESTLFQSNKNENDQPTKD